MTRFAWSRWVRQAGSVQFLGQISVTFACEQNRRTGVELAPMSHTTLSGTAARNRSRSAFFALLFALLLAACQPQDIRPARWTSADVRALEPPNAADPAFDLIAAYARVTRTDLELRVDFLGSPGTFDYDVYAALGAEGDSAGPFPLSQSPDLAWQITVGLPARGKPRAFDAAGRPVKLRPRILRDAEQDAVTLRLSLTELEDVLSGDPREAAFQLFVARPGQRQGMDTTPVLRVNGPAVTARAPLLLVFWDSLPADTPAQALRRWDGAHTGPFGQRHGLRVLLDTAEETGIPLAVLDLTRPERLSALDALGGLEQVRRMAKDGLLVLPQTSYGDPRLWEASRADSQAAIRSFGLPESAFHYGALDTPTGDQAAFASLAEVNHLLDWNGTRLVPLPVENGDEDETGTEALSTGVRAALLAAALTEDSGDLVVLGGALPRSPWGDSLIAGPSLRYIAGHPWMHALSAKEVLEFPAQPGEPACPDLLCLLAPDRDPPELTLGNGVFARQARQMALRLSEPTPDERLKVLHSIYLSQVEVLHAASRWEEHPAESADCTTDLTGDGTPDCVLSSDRVLLILDPRGGRLALASARVGARVLQIVGPRSQFAVGLGDSLEWRPERGLLADPQEVAGAFADPGPEWAVYTAQAKAAEATLTHPQTGAVKRFRITENGFVVTLDGTATVATTIPLALLDERAHQPGWYARYSAPQPNDDSTWEWKLANAAQVRLTAQGATLSARHFAESVGWLGQPEDPNAEYSAGIFVPFPMALVEVQPLDSDSLTIMIEVMGR